MKINQNWNYEQRWTWGGMPNGPYIIVRKYHDFEAALMGHCNLGSFKTLGEAKKACKQHLSKGQPINQ